MFLTTRLQKLNLSLLKPEYVFLVLGGIFGIFFVFLNLLFRVPDEQRHLLHAYQVATLHVLPERYITGVGGTLPSSIVHLKNLYDSNLSSGQKFTAALKHKLNPSQSEPTHFENTALPEFRN